jgi:hypothetical protein
MTAGGSTWRWWVERAIGLLAAGGGIVAWIGMTRSPSSPLPAPSAAPVTSAVVAVAVPASSAAPGYYRVAHILVQWAGATDSTQSRSKAEALLRIDEVRARPGAGQDFGALASEYGDDATRTRGGNLGIVRRRFLPKTV